MTNLLTETIGLLKENGKTLADIVWHGTRSDRYISDIANDLDVEYYSGYGGNEIDINLILVGKDFWLERMEYDGSEWWVYKEFPATPDTIGETSINNGKY